MKQILSRILAMAIFFAPALSVMAQAPSQIVPAAQYYQGGQEAMYKFINETKVYPLQAKRNRIQGECNINLTIEADGRISAAAIVSNKGGGLGEEALRVVKLLKFNPPGQKISANIPVIFKL